MSRIWDSWPKELPLETPETRAVYDELTSYEHVKAMTAETRANTIARVTEALGGNTEHTAIVMMGGTSQRFEFYCADTEVIEFRQEAFFRYLFGINEPDCFGIIDLHAKDSVLFVNQLPESAARWQGPNRELSYYVDKYGVEQAEYVHNLTQTLTSRGIKKILVLYGLNTDSGSYTQTTAQFEGIEQFEVDKTTLHPILVKLRVIKTQKEIELMRKACRLSAQAHTFVMRNIKPGMTELQCEALFKAYTSYYGGSRCVAYTCICGAGPRGSILHYGHAGYPNDKHLCNGDMIVLDMGAEYMGYATDLTRSYPVNGVFTPEQKAIHRAACKAQQVVYDMLKPGTCWKACHQAAEKVILEALLELNIVKGSIEELQENYVASVFMPHGLGHMVGLNVHDPKPADDRKENTPGLSWLRFSGILEENMVITVEPGIYFNQPWIESALKDETLSKYINKEEVEKWYKFGGVRMEDDVLITKDGYENLAGEWPTTAEEIEAVCQNK